MRPLAGPSSRDLKMHYLQFSIIIVVTIMKDQFVYITILYLNITSNLELRESAATK